ncbi:CLUMA_CG014523, isoform A [Clunio marinus]|uniref:CLUMA_CG014523, isoform A n=1 Tax=Clunio marinus TaxID=568069 RepID=A0A1J1ISD5_9DIPT|nr:CLUMA_CG014523, isoform A [Clunio marinus]
MYKWHWNVIIAFHFLINRMMLKASKETKQELKESKYRSSVWCLIIHLKSLKARNERNRLKMRPRMSVDVINFESGSAFEKVKRLELVFVEKKTRFA